MAHRSPNSAGINRSPGCCGPAQVSLEEWSSGGGRERIRSETPDGTPLNLWRATPCGDGWVEGLEGTEDLGAEGDKQAGEGFTKLWHGEGEEPS